MTRLRILPLLEGRPRGVSFDEECVKGYMEASVVSPVVVFEGCDGYILADGYHRVEAARRRGQATIEAEIRPGGDREATRYTGRTRHSWPDEEWLRECAGRREDIIRFRVGVGLPTDDVVIDRVLADWRLGLLVYETDEELARIAPVEDVVEAARPRLRAYAEAHPESYAGVWQEYEDGAPYVCIAFTGDLRAHHAALDLDRVRVLSAIRTMAELEAIAARIGFDELERVGARINALGVDVVANVVNVGADGPDEAAARALLSARYGGAVRLEWPVGPAIAC